MDVYTSSNMAALLFVLLAISASSAQAQGPNVIAAPGEVKVKDYFKRYGYNNGSYSGKPGELESLLVKFQYFANITVTGKIDEETLKRMDDIRCGVKDPDIKVPSGNLGMVPAAIKINLRPGTILNRVRRYNHQGTVWLKNKLTWNLINMPRYSKVTREEILQTIRTATGLWSRRTNMDFEEVDSQDPDIIVKFGAYYHDDPFPFDGPGGTLAHAFYPLSNKGLAGDMHFDDDEDFTINSPNGINLLWVATHELGHSLGLDHSPVTNAVMYPWYQKYKPGFDLEYDDISGIQTLYGGKPRVATEPPTTTALPTTVATTAPPTTMATTTAPPTKKPTTKAPTTVPTTKRITTTVYVPKRPCPTERVNAIYDLPRISHRVFIAGGKDLYFLKKNGIKYGPFPLRNYYPKFRIPSIDAAFNMEYQSLKITVMFSGVHYYIFRLFSYFSGPHDIYGNNNGLTNPLNFQFPSWVQKIDGAMTWHRNSMVYIFANDKYWKYDDSNLAFYPGYPRSISSGWINVPNNIDGCYSSSAEKRTYFISGDQFYLLDDQTVSVAPGFPKNHAFWLNCGDTRSRLFVAPTLPSNVGQLGAEP